MTAPQASVTATAPKVLSGPYWLLREIDEGEPTSASLEPGVRLVAGRGSTVDLTLRDPGVSRRHFEIESHGDRLELRDLGSKGGTVVNGQQVSRVVIGPGDIIEAGSSRLIVLQIQARMPDLERGTLEIVHYNGGNLASRTVLSKSLVVGRLPECDVVVDDRQVSRRHIEIRPEGPGAIVNNLAPANRTEVNGRGLVGSRAVSPGDRIQLAGLDQILVIESPSAQPGPIAVEVRSDGSAQAWSIEIDAGLDAAVAEVAEELAIFLGLESSHSQVWTLYQGENGLVLHPDNRWIDSGVKRGDQLRLIATDMPPPGPTQAVRYGPSRIALNQLPRSVTPPERYRLRTPRPPETQSLRGRGVSWQIVGGLGIIVAGIGLALVDSRYARFAALGGIVGVFSIGAGIMGEQSRRKHGVRQFRQRLVDLHSELTDVRALQSRLLHAANPSPAEAVDWAAHRHRRLWERRPGDSDFLRLRIGTGRRLALIDPDDSAVHSDSPHAPELLSVLSQHLQLADVPILTPSPQKAPILGLVGSRRDVLEVTSWLVIQAALLHAPAELEMAIPAVNQDWLWARWLPHLERPDGVNVTWNEADAAVLAKQLRAQTETKERTGFSRIEGPAKLIVVPHGASEALTDTLAKSHDANSLCIVLADRASDLPSRVDAVITVDGDSATLEGPTEDGPVGSIAVDRLDHETASKVARQLGRYVDGRRPPKQTSSQLGLLDLLGTGTPEKIDLAKLWSSRPGSALSAVVGTTLDDQPLVLGFRSDGVHGVVGGTTGSGKSEFLQTLLASLALTHLPSQLSLFLIDFKGGATFRGLAGLPHVAGVVTDLEKDATLANRAFTSLEAEMARRKEILDKARVPGLVEYERLPEAASDPLPALLVVIDEFALLVRQQPEVKERLDLVATQGRSLGVHLLLATQSPTNVITPAIRSNTQVWISLRVVDDSESVELLGQRDAARIPSDRPGRGFVRFGGAETITGFQTARIARPLGQGSARGGVAIRPFADSEPAPRQQAAATTPQPPGRVITELEKVCEVIADQARKLGIANASPLWLEPLPHSVPAPSSSDLLREPGDLTALVGLMDDPARHVQLPWSVDLGRTGNLLIVGARGTGKSATMRQVVTDLAGVHSPTDLHFYGVESGTGSISALAKLPHCGTVAPAADRERLYRLFTRLIRLMERRREDLAASGYGDFRTWRRTSAMPEPWVLLGIDDYSSFKETADNSGLGLLNDQLLSLAQGGPAVGIHIILTTSQASDMRTNLVNLFSSRLLLRQVEVADYSLLDLRLRPNEMPPFVPGRALVTGGFEMHVYSSPADRIESIRSAWADSTGGPTSIVRLPHEIYLRELIELPTIKGRPVIGVGGDEHTPLSLDFERSEPHLVIIGEGRTGRSTTLITIYEAILISNPEAVFYIVSPRPSPVRALEARSQVRALATTPEEIAETLRNIQTAPTPGTIILIDDAESLAGDLGDLLEKLLRNATQLGIRTFTTGRSADLSRSFEGWVRYLLSLRTGLLLAPAPDGGFVFDVRLPLTHIAMTTGRGFLCERGAVTFAQIALPTSSEVDAMYGSERR